MTYKLFLDDLRFPPSNVYPDGPNEWMIARSIDDAIWYVENCGVPEYISFDHDLADVKTGYDFAKWFADYIMDNEIKLPDNFDYLVHSMNPVGSVNIDQYMKNFLNTWRKK